MVLGLVVSVWRPVAHRHRHLITHEKTTNLNPTTQGGLLRRDQHHAGATAEAAGAQPPGAQGACLCLLLWIYLYRRWIRSGCVCTFTQAYGLRCGSTTNTIDNTSGGVTHLRGVHLRRSQRSPAQLPAQAPEQRYGCKYIGVAVRLWSVCLWTWGVKTK
jgi:hypothetical protein